MRAITQTTGVFPIIEVNSPTLLVNQYGEEMLAMGHSLRADFKIL